MEGEGQIIEQIKRHFHEFFENPDHGSHYIDKIKQAISDQKFRIILNINDVRNFGSDLATEILNRPREHLIAIQEVMTELALNNDPSAAKVLKFNDLQVGFDGSFGTHAVSPRGLMSNLLNKLVVVEGIVTKCSSVRPKLVRSVHFCPTTKSYSTKDYRDNTDLDIGIQVKGRERLPTTSTFPTKDADGNPLELEQGYCIYKDYQTIILQEMPERARVGQLPRSVELILQHDLVDKIKPGDRVQCVGVYRPLASVQNGQTQGVFRSVLMCNNVSIIGKEIGAVKLTGTDVGNIREISERSDVLHLLASSFCPSIYGHDFIKRALILQLLGGCERNLENGTHLRGDINLMMVGDPSTAKSQLLRAVLDIAPLAISTTGRGSSGVGLTAAVTSDAETNERRLEAGAMVLADRGVVCIDEFDKMSENDRVAIHEVMEQQTVTIAKAGIHASLNARCSVVAAANPIYGQYDRTRRPQDNIGLPDSLLSRFDLLFIVLDQLDPIIDRTISEHVIRSHQYRRPGSTMEPEPLDKALNLSADYLPSDGSKDTIVWQRGGRGSEKSTGTGSAGDILTKEFLRKYIHYARNRVKPVLSAEAMDAISVAYADMRSKQTPKNLPITARSLETMIRLASAHAKSRLSNTVDELDVEEILEIMNYVLFHEIGDNKIDSQRNEYLKTSISTNTSTNKKRKNIMESNSNNSNNNNNSGNIGDNGDDDYNMNEEHKTGEGLLKKSKYVVEDDTAIPIDKDNSRYLSVQNIVIKLGKLSGGEAVSVEDILNRLNTDLPTHKQFNSKELQSILTQMEEENKIMYQDGEVHIL